jgi:hypothetical protein
MKTENQLRHIARRKGYRLIKSRQRNPAHYPYGLFAIVDDETGGTIHPDPVGRCYCLDLAGVESWLCDEAA